MTQRFCNCRYYLNKETEDKFSSYFELNAETGDLFLKKELDYEKHAVMTLYVTAVDDGASVKLSSQCVVVVKVTDVNDNFPTITINSKPITKNQKHDHTTLPTRKHSAAYTTNVNIKGDKSDKKPFFQVLENAAPNEFVAHVTVNDEDSGRNGKFSCSLHNEEHYNKLSKSLKKTENLKSTSESFALKQMYETEFKIVTAKSLDREEASVHSLMVVCVDKGYPAFSNSLSLNVEVLDVNDNRPEFTKRNFEAFVRGKLEASTSIIRTTAYDEDEGLNNKLMYAMRTLPPKELLAITSTEHLKSWNESKTGFPQTIQNVSKSPGKHNNTKYYRARHKQIRRYQLAFSINPSNGLISVAQSISIGSTIHSPIQLNFIVNASDKGFHSLWNTAFLSIYLINDGIELFRFSSFPYEFKVEENLSLGSQVGHVEVAKVYNFSTAFLFNYFLTTQNCSASFFILDNQTSVSRFKIGPTTGIVETTESLDREEIDLYSFYVIVTMKIPKVSKKTHKGKSHFKNKKHYNHFNDTLLGLEYQELLCSPVNVAVVDFNDNSPYFTFPSSTNNKVRLSTFDQPGSVIGRVIARDNDLGENSLLSFSIVSGNEDGLVRLDPDDGVIVLMKSLPYQHSSLNKRTISSIQKIPYSQQDILEVPNEEDNSEAYYTFIREMVVEVEDNGFPTLRNRTKIVLIASPDYSLSTLRYDLNEKRYNNQTANIYHFLANEDLVQVLAAILAGILILISVLIVCICVFKKKHNKGRHVVLKRDDEEIDLAYIKTNKIHDEDLREGASKSLLLPQQSASFNKTATLDPSFYQVNVYKHQPHSSAENNPETHTKDDSETKFGYFFKRFNKKQNANNLVVMNNLENVTKSDSSSTFQNILYKFNKNSRKADKQADINQHYDETKTSNSEANYNLCTSTGIHNNNKNNKTSILSNKYSNDYYNNTRPFYSSTDEIDTNNNDYKLRSSYDKESICTFGRSKKVDLTNSVLSQVDKSTNESRFSGKNIEGMNWSYNHADSVRPVGEEFLHS